MRRLSVVMFAAGVGLLAASGLASVNQASPPNTFRLSLAFDIDYADPALAYYAPTWALLYATGATLYSYPDAPAPKGARLVPEVAAGFPTVSRDGRTYTIRLKRTYRLSNGQPVTALNFEWAFRRLLSRRIASPAQPFLEDIVGARQVINGEAKRARGVRVLDRYTLRLRLARPAHDILARLAMPFFQAVTRGLPFEPEGVRPPIASAGPYYWREWTRNRSIVLERNPYYRGPRPRRVRRILVDIGLPRETIKVNIDSGRTDLGDIPPGAHTELARRYGVRRRSPGRYFANVGRTIWYLALNHDRPLFRGPGPAGNVRLKKAINFALDRVAIARQEGAFAVNPHDQLLPPTMRGFDNVALYPARPDFARARRLAANNTRGGEAVLYCWYRPPERSQCEIIQANLREIGVRADIKFQSPNTFEFPSRRGEPFDLSLERWRADYFDPHRFVFLVDGRTIRPARNTNVSYFNHPGFNRRIAEAERLVGPARYRAYSRLDHDLMRSAAPVAVIGVANDRQYVSARTGCFHSHPVYDLDLPAICLRR